MALLCTGEWLLPLWAQYIIGASAVLIAGSFLWTKVINPVAKLITLTGALVPILGDLTEQFKDSPHAFRILKEIVEELRTNGGSSLRDVINRLETASKARIVEAEVLKMNAETARLLSAQDRALTARLTVAVDHLIALVTVKYEQEGRAIAAGLHKIAQTEPAPA